MNWRAIGPAVVLAGGIIVTAIVATVLTRTAAQRDLQAFEAAAAAAQDAVLRRVETSIALLRGTAGLFAAKVQPVTVESFRAYVERIALREQYPGLLGLGFSRRIEPGAREALEIDLRRQGHAGFRVWPDDAREELHSIVFLEPLDRRNRAAIGYDMYTHPVRRAAMSCARDLGHACASGAVELVQEIEERKQPGFLIYLPVYRGGRMPPDVAARREQLEGFAYAPIRAGDFLSSAFSRETTPRIGLAVYHGAGSRPEALLYAQSPEGMAEQPRFVRTTQVEVAEQAWTFEFRSAAGVAEAFVVPSVVALTGLALSLLCAGLWRRQQDAAWALQEEARRKDEFIAMLSHELRNPLAPLKSGLELLRLGGPPGTEDRVREMMERQVGHLARLVDDLLESSRISRGLLELKRAPVRLSEVLGAAVEAAESLIRECGHRLELDLPREPLWIEGDAVRLAQVFANLLNNAAKYTPRGGRIWLRAARADEGRVRISVRDSGAGFAPEAQGRLFEMFSRGEGSSGLGVGLALSRRLVQMHGGTIEARSEGGGRGAEFTVMLPVAAAPARAAQPAEPSDGRGLRVLVADDNRDAAESLAALLQALGHDVEVAYDGVEAVQAARAFRPQVVLLDLGMPRLDGYGAAREIRRELDGGAPRIVALTGWGQEADRRRVREAGFDDHLVKPAGLDALRRVLFEPTQRTEH